MFIKINNIVLNVNHIQSVVYYETGNTCVKMTSGESFSLPGNFLAPISHGHMQKDLSDNKASHTL